MVFWPNRSVVSGKSFRGNSFVEIANYFGEVVCVELFNFHNVKLLFDQLANIAIEVATIGKDFLDWSQPVLPDL